MDFLFYVFYFPSFVYFLSLSASLSILILTFLFTYCLPFSFEKKRVIFFFSGWNVAALHHTTTTAIFSVGDLTHSVHLLLPVLL